ncbi:MAG: M48 family metalloprotease [Planctomycetota bacterium]
MLPRVLATALGLVALALIEGATSTEPLGSRYAALATMAAIPIGSGLIAWWVTRRGRAVQLLNLGVVITAALFIGLAFECRWWDHCLTVVPPQIPAVHRLIAVVPFLLGLYAARQCTPPALRSPWAWRPALVLGLPYIGITTVIDLGWYLPGVEERLVLDPLLALCVLLALLVLLLWLAPRMVSSSWPHEPLPAGPLRDRLEAITDQAEVAVRDIRVWETWIPNACVTGLAPRERQVFFTRGIIQILGPDEIAAVHAHEVAHVRSGHLWILLGWLATGMFILVAVDPWLGGEWAVARWATYAVLGGGGFLGFTALSRHFEREADEFAAAMTSPETVARTLRRVSLDEQPRPTRVWKRHPSIDERVRILDNFTGEESNLARRTRQLGAAVATFAIVAMVAMGISTIALDRDRQRALWDRAVHLVHMAEARQFRLGGEVTEVEATMIERAAALCTTLGENNTVRDGALEALRTRIEAFGPSRD